MTGPTLGDLAELCTRCGHQNGAHTHNEKRSRWGWPIYDELWATANGACSVPDCTCEARTNDPAAAPAPPRTFTPPTPAQAQPCAFFAFGDKRRCGTTPARLYPTGWRCEAHSPASLADEEEPREGGCAPLRHYCTPNTRCATWKWQQQPWRVLATGGRDREDKGRIWSEFDKILLIHPRLTVIQGAAYPRPERGIRPDRSADWLIHLWCQRNPGVVEETHAADWNTCSAPDCTPKHRRQRKNGSTYCPDAGFWRNGLMVKTGADECVAFPGQGGGTRDCMRQAAAAGITVRPIWAHDLVTVAHA